MANDVTYQSATLATPPSGTVVATQDVGAGRQLQCVLIGGAGNVTHTGAATFDTSVLATNAVVNVSASGDLTVNTDLNTGTSALTLQSGGLLTIPSSRSLQSTGAINLTSDRMAIANSATTTRPRAQGLRSRGVSRVTPRLSHGP